MATASDKRLRRLLAVQQRLTRHRLAAVCITVVVGLLYLAEALTAVEASLVDLRFRLLKREASGNVVLVGIDARSLRELDTWPWPRTLHAALLDRLAASGARRVALDIDFSARSTQAADATLADAIGRFPGEVILPTFAQFEHGRTGGGIVVESAPLPELREKAAVAFANVRQEGDGVVRAFTPAPGAPSIPALLAGRRQADGFQIDFGIRPATVPFVSYVDLLEGRVDPARLRGKDVIVGAVAVELGDVLPVPLYGNLPGPLVIALGYESLVQGRAIAGLGPGITVLCAAFLVLALVGRFRRWSWRLALPAVFILAGAITGAALVLQAGFALAVDTAPLYLALVLLLLYGVIAQIERQAVRIFHQSRAVLDRNNIIRAVVDSSFDAIVVTDRRGEVTMLNRAAEELFALAAGAVLGRRFDAFVAGGEETLGRALCAGQPVEAGALRPDGGLRAVDLVARRAVLPVSRHPLERRAKPRTVTIHTLRDIEERKKIDEERRAAHDQVVAANRAKSEFLAAMSHELRTPLNAVIGFSEVLKGELFGPIGSPRYRGYAEDIHHSGTHLLEIVNDILDNARVEAGRVALNQSVFRIAGVVNAGVRLVAERAAAAGLRLHVGIEPGLPDLWADERLVKQVLVNLLSNAVKFTPRDGTVRVTAALAADGSLALGVADSGIGIPPEQIEEVVKPFYQVDRSLARRYEGTGLGLPLVKAFMELHGGRFTLDSALGEGTTARCFFPAERVRAAAGRKAA